MLLLSLKNYSTILEVFSTIKLEEKILITISQLQDGENKTELNIGLLEIHGEVIGVKEETLD